MGPGRFAVKRLAAVEIDPGRSNQHEFNAGKLRTGLGYGSEKVNGHLSLLIFADEGDEPIVDQDAFTLYDARARNPTRSEWHLYYYSKVLPQVANADDLLVLYRPTSGTDLHGVVLRHGSAHEDRLLNALMLRDSDVLAEFRLVDPPGKLASPAIGEALAEQPPAEYPVGDHPVVLHAIRDGAVPSGRVLAGVATSIVGKQRAKVDPDGYLSDALEAETALYFEIETSIGDARLAELRERSAPLEVMLDWAMTIHQARRSRRGQSLQLHFATILGACGIPHTAQCRTERGETPDFVVPGCDDYHDSDFPSHHLRMVACKSTSKERWRQVLNEAQRIPEKYLLTLDRRLTAPVIEQMNSARLRPYLPKSIIDEQYAGHPSSGGLRTVRDLVSALELAVSNA